MRILLLLLFFGLSLDSAIREEEAEGFRVIFFFVMFGMMATFTWIFGRIVEWLIQFRTSQQAARLGILGEHTITLTPETLREHTAVSDATTAWKGIHRIEANGSHLFIYLQPDLAHPIPRRAFATPAEAEEFLAAARAYYDAAVDTVSPA